MFCFTVLVSSSGGSCSLDAGHDLEQRGLAHAVGAHDADLGAGEEAHGHVVQDDLAVERLADLLHLVDELCHLSCSYLARERLRGDSCQYPIRPAHKKGAAPRLRDATTNSSRFGLPIAVSDTR